MQKNVNNINLSHDTICNKTNITIRSRNKASNSRVIFQRPAAFKRFGNQNPFQIILTRFRHHIEKMELLESAELFAKGKHSRDSRIGSAEADVQHLKNVVNRLKSLGVIDKEILCTGWLYETMEKTNTSFDELLEKFGTRIAVMVWSLSRDYKLPKKQREMQYVKQLKGASFDAKLIKLCDISANLTKLKKQDASKSKKTRNIKQARRYLAVIKKELVEETEDYPGTATLLESINQAMKQLSQRPKITKNKS